MRHKLIEYLSRNTLLFKYTFLSKITLVAAILLSIGKAHALPEAPPHFNSVDAVMAAYGPGVRAKLQSLFAQQNVTYPPEQMTWIALKEERLLLIFARDHKGVMKKVLSYPIIGASGVAGPKLKEGDKQMPEGFYTIAAFRPTLVAHIGLEVNYPNSFDRYHAKIEKRKNPGSDILIHGSKWSTGCLAMGNEPIEEMFVLAHDTGSRNIKLIFAPCDLRLRKPQVNFKTQPQWLPKLYDDMAIQMKKFAI